MAKRKIQKPTRFERMYKVVGLSEKEYRQKTPYQYC